MIKKFNLVLTNQKNCYDNNKTLINSNNTTITPVTVILGDQSKFPLRSKRRYLFNTSSMTQKCLLLFIILSIILTGLVIIGFIRIMQLKMNYDYTANEQIKNDEIIQRLSRVELNINRTVQHLANRDICDS